MVGNNATIWLNGGISASKNGGLTDLCSMDFTANMGREEGSLGLYPYYYLDNTLQVLNSVQNSCPTLNKVRFTENIIVCLLAQPYDHNGYD